jgi:hypothetical protein
MIQFVIPDIVKCTTKRILLPNSWNNIRWQDRLSRGDTDNTVGFIFLLQMSSARKFFFPVLVQRAQYDRCVNWANTVIYVRYSCACYLIVWLNTMFAYFILPEVIKQKPAIMFVAEWNIRRLRAILDKAGKKWVPLMPHNGGTMMITHSFHYCSWHISYPVVDK